MHAALLLDGILFCRYQLCGQALQVSSGALFAHTGLPSAACSLAQPCSVIRLMPRQKQRQSQSRSLPAAASAPEGAPGEQGALQAAPQLSLGPQGQRWMPARLAGCAAAPSPL